MKVLVTGVKGQLGFDVVNELKKRGHTAVGTDIDEMDITDADSVNKAIKNIKPDGVIHCAAWTAVDLAEDKENISKVRAVNAYGTENIAKACRDLDIKMIYLSTDYVFDGQGTHFWEADETDFAPLNVYGLTKYEGECAVRENLDKYFIVRIAWVFGRNGKNFIKTMLNLGKKYDNIKVVNDQIGSPTYTFDLAKLLADMIETEKYGIYHATNEGICSWYDFACEIFKKAVEMGHTEYKNVTVEPVATAEYGVSKAKRPFNSRMSKEKLTQNGFKKLPDWQDALSRYLKEIEF
ncbi:MAG: dTDP-4-dehydrorhamnose reductase [Clostridia bacterium]|nr:dTDP-4-dehydrorhamnose reductase [Clostridia bacterium]